MATSRARLYAINPAHKFKAEPRGQAARLLSELRENTEPRLAEDIDLAISTSATPYVTRQDSLRITLYYLILFRKAGAVIATAQPATETEEAVFEAPDGSEVAVPVDIEAEFEDA